MTDNQFEQLFGIMTKAVSSIQNLEGDVKELRQDVSSLQQGQNELRQDVSSLKKGQDELRQDVSSLQQDVSSLRQDFNQFVTATEKNFVEVKREIRSINRLDKQLAKDVAEARSIASDVEDRVEVLEEKVAA